ncbi:MAG: hypothetical protein WC314_19320 [Vulcanimicrobiota bacterium]
MQILTHSSNWIRRQTASPQDFRPQPSGPVEGLDSGLTIGRATRIGTAVGAGVGAVAGGTWAGQSVSNSFEYFDYVTSEIPLASSGPSASAVLGAHLDQFQSVVGQNSSDSASAEQTLQYLSYLKHQNPKVPSTDLEGIYRSLEGQFGDDSQVRQALNMIAAHSRKYGTTPNQAHAEFSNYFGYQNSFQEGTRTFAEDQKLAPGELNEVMLEYVKRHSSPIGHLGMTKGVVLGVASGLAVGAVVGAVAGVAVGVGVHLYNRLTAT